MVSTFGPWLHNISTNGLADRKIKDPGLCGSVGGRQQWAYKPIQPKGPWLAWVSGRVSTIGPWFVLFASMYIIIIYFLYQHFIVQEI